MDFDVSRILGMERRVDCTACGERAPLSARTCPECGAPLRDEDYDHESFDTVSGSSESLTGAVRQSDPRKNLRRLQEAVRGVQRGDLPLEGYQERVDGVHRTVSQGLVAFSSPEYKQKLETLPPLEQELLKRIHSQLVEYLAGLDRMRVYYTSLDVEDALTGFATASQAIEEIEGVQDRARTEQEKLQPNS